MSAFMRLPTPPARRTTLTGPSRGSRRHASHGAAHARRTAEERRPTEEKVATEEMLAESATQVITSDHGG